jgi:glycerophosphoryl diester phosphodiesterase
MKRFSTLWSQLLILILGGCERVEFFPDRPISTSTLMIAHKGGGNFDEGDTMEACIHGLTLMDGIEVDIQKSADDDLWLNHSAMVDACGSFEETCFDLVPSSRIIDIDNCLGASRDYTRLEQVFSYMHDNCPEKYISLDVKAWSPCGARGLNIIHEMNQLAQAILDLNAKYNLPHVVVESEVGDFLYYIKKRNSKIETYLATLGDLELGMSRALDAGFSGISFQYKFREPLTKEIVDLMHRKGLKVQLWTVNEPADIEEAISIGADFIQTDNF